MRGTTRLAVLALGALVTAPPLPAWGSCAAPFVTVVEAAERLEVRGQAFVGGGVRMRAVALVSGDASGATADHRQSR